MGEMELRAIINQLVELNKTLRKIASILEEMKEG